MFLKVCPSLYRYTYFLGADSQSGVMTWIVDEAEEGGQNCKTKETAHGQTRWWKLLNRMKNTGQNWRIMKKLKSKKNWLFSDGRDEIWFEELFEEHQDNFARVLSEFKLIWDGRLKRIIVENHRMKSMLSNEYPMKCVLYCAGEWAMPIGVLCPF